MNTTTKKFTDNVAMTKVGMMNKVLSGVLMVALVLVGLATSADAALNTYYYKGDSNFTTPETVAGVTTNVVRACSQGGNNTLASLGAGIPQIATAGGTWDGCADNRYAYNAGLTPFQWVLADTAYGTAMDITGQAGTVLNFRSGGVTCEAQINLGYVSGGTFTSFGSSAPQSLATNTWTNVSFDLSAVSGTVPSGGTVAVEYEVTANAGPDCRFAFGNNINGTASSSGSFSVDEIVNAGGGGSFEELEYFDTADDVCDYSSWSSSSESTGNCGGTFDAGTTGGVLYVYNSAQGGNGDGTLTGSAGTGPTSLHSGTSPPGGFLFLENSGAPPFADMTFTRDTTFDATAYEANISFASSLYTLNEGGALRFQVNDGGGWTTEWEQINGDGNAGAWTEVDINLFAGTVSIDGGASVATSTYGGSDTAYTSGTLQYRFVFVSGTSFSNDIGLDTIRVYGPAAGGGGPTCSDSIQNQGETGVDCGGPCAPCGATTVLNSCEMDGDFCTYWTPSDNGTNTPWMFDPDFTTSNNVGPDSAYSGSQYVYTEASTPAAGDEWYLTSQALDADTYDITLDFWYNKHHNGIATCDLAVEVSTDGGASWPAASWSTSVDDGVGNANGTNWRNQAVNLSAYTGNILVRFRAASGGNWQCDTALDLVELSGVTAGTGGGGGSGFPVVNPGGTYIEAEDYTTMSAPNPWDWQVQSLVPGFSGTGYLYTTNGGTGANTQGARADYPLDFGGGGTYCIWIRAMDQSGAGGGDSVFWGVDGNSVGAITQTADNVWAWDSDIQNGNNCFTVSAGVHTLNLWPREAGQKTDAILISTVDANADPTAGGLLTGDGDTTTVIPPGATVVDPTDTGPQGANYLTIPESQVVNGAAVNLRKVDLTLDPAEVVGADELVFDTDQTVTYRALGPETDGFDDFSVLPKWQHADVGNDVPGAPVMEQTSGSLKLKGSGQDIWNTADYFSYHFQGGITGDFTIDVEVKGLVDSAGGTQNAWAKAGIMVRQSMANNSRHAMMVTTPGNGARFQNRPTDGAASLNPSTDDGTPTNTWLRIKRVGDTFTGYYSSDGIAWTLSASADVIMTDPVNVGLAVTSHDTNRDSIATFDNFLYMPATTSGMSETWATANTAPTWTAIDTTDWVDGTFGISMRGGSNIETKLYDYSKCTDTSSSSIAIGIGQTVSGSAASLSGLFSTTGNVANFSYMIDGATVTNPWNSYAAQADGTSGAHTLTVTGTDPDCGGRQISTSESITVNNTCADASPSTITILTGQAVGGPSVDLTALHSNTGNVGTFVYKVNGVLVATPDAWNSSAYGNLTSENVILDVTGTDPDCGGRSVTGLNTIAVDNTCVRNEPSISFNKDIGYVGPGRAIPYQVTIRNEDSFNCSASTFDVNITSDPVNSDFDASYFNPLTSNLNILLNGRESATMELAVEATAGAVEWNSKDVTLTINSQEDPLGAHNDGATPGPTTGTVTTKVFLVSPITHNSVTTDSGKWNGTWGTSEAGSKYGNFDCLTCHSKTGSEIKWMRGAITTPDGSDWGMSSQQTLPVQFKDARTATEIVAEGGDPITDVYWGHDDPTDTGAGRTTSDRTCEVCHSITQHHRYNTNVDPTDPPEGPVGAMTITAGATHFPGRDCTDCHRHELGFTADCTGCHGDPPLEATLGGPNGLADIPAATGSVTPGTHYKHTVVLGFPCEYCHNGWRNVGEMPKEIGGKQDINHVFNVFSDLGMTDPVRNDGHYTGQDGVSYEGTVIAPGAGTMTCESIYCHGGTQSMGGTNPTWNGNITCNACHGTSAQDTPPGYSHTTHVGEMGLDCTLCHYTGGQQAGYNGHVNGRVNIQLDPSLPSKGGAPMYRPFGGSPLVTYDSNSDGSDMPPSQNYGSCVNIACHYGNETPNWNNGGQQAQCNDCHNDGAPDDSTLELQLKTAAPNTGNHEQHVHPEMAHFGDADVAIHTRMISTFVSGCESCHGGGANTGDHAGHVNLAVDFGGGMGYTVGDGTCTSQCHTLDSETGGNITWGSTEFLDCSACHQAPYLGPTVVDPAGAGAGMAASGYGSHLKGANADALGALTSWTAQCKKCHPYHAGGFEITQPGSAWNQLGDGTDMAYKLGLQFPVTGGIHLERSGVAPNSEAEMCWSCHDANSISEWGQNNNAMTGSMAYDYGSVTSSNWTSTVWTSGYAGFTYKTAAIQSTHAANQPVLAIDSANGVNEVSRSGVDDVTAIRCTYCHDVHDRNKALVDHNAGTYETLTGAPYLRGTWMGNPYKEDGAPQAGTTYTNGNTESFGAVPRASNNVNQEMGGYWIDQNSGDPNSGTNYDQFGGLCQMCHGSDINTLNQYEADGVNWVSGLNGHANSVKGGSGVGGNIYTSADRGGGSTNNYNGNMGYWGFVGPGDGGGGIRGGDGNSYNINNPGVDGYGNEPFANEDGTEGGGFVSDWDNLRTFDVTGAANNAGFHTFSCAKCHNPHASRLPKLMISNCLDTKHNSWDDNTQLGNIGIAALNNTSASNFTTAQNCHRVGGNDPNDGNDAAGQGSGWNSVTPW